MKHHTPQRASIDLMCPTCHDHVEAGRYDELGNAKEIQLYIAAEEPELLEIKKMRKDNLAA